MKKQIYPFLLLLLAAAVKAAPGDTTKVSAHQAVDMTWYGNYNDWAVFPDSNFQAYQVLMRYTMGCATGGCSDWDYTTVIDLMRPTGIMDSAIKSIDTLSTNPLQIDTTWRRFEIKESLELAKVITPYGGALPQNWTRTFYFDVTDLVPLMHDSVEIRAQYQGWSSGFSVSLEFLMIEGTPPRDVLSVQNLYKGGFAYRDSAKVEREILPARLMRFPNQTQYVGLNMAPSGHGFVNALNCAEFCEKDYIVKVDGQTAARQAMWRNDCGMNDLWPQAGTWLYDRANWCPGDRVNTHRHDLSNFIQADSARVNVDIEAYAYTVPSGQSPASYNMSAQLVAYGSFNKQVDAELSQILKPTAEDEYARLNPVCDEALIEVRNTGAQPLQSLTIQYGLTDGLHWQEYQWTGNLAALERLQIALPMDSLVHWTSLGSTLEFAAKIVKVNGGTDERSFNNQQKRSFHPAPQYPAKMRFDLRTNNAASETFWELRSYPSGQLIHSGDNLQNSTAYRDTFKLQPGCYALIIGDRDEDGLSFFGNNDGSGRIGLRNLDGPFFSKTYNPNFGTEIRDYFTVGYGIGLPKQLRTEQQIELYPNPSQGQVELELPYEVESLFWRLRDAQGRVVAQEKRDTQGRLNLSLDLSAQQKGLYILEIAFKGQSQQTKLLLH